jgi:hypothetical protein
VAMADVGDFLLQNDQIKVAILGPHDSQGPGVFGGSIVDVDIRRDRLGFAGAQGHDRFAELFPVANLLVPSPDPTLMQVKVLEDGSSGTEAAIRVQGEGAPLFEALGILHNKADELRLLFPDVKTSFHFRTDYIVRPGERHVLIRTTIALEDAPTAAGCAVTPASCNLPSCDFGLEGDGNGCFVCACSQPIPLDQYHGPSSVFGQIFGDDVNVTSPPPKYRGGVIAGDFVFFGNQTDVFAPGIGYDTDKVVHDAFYSGRNTFQKPLSFDFVTASGGDVSYGYFTVPAPGDTQPVTVNMPLFTSAATAFLSAGKSCLFDPSDDATCDAKRSFTFERWSSVDVLAAANVQAEGDGGVIDVANADVGLPLVYDGSFRADLPAGDYVVVARSQDGMGLSAPQSIHVVAGSTVVVNPTVVVPGTVQYRVTDETGALSPAKVALVSIDAQGNPLEHAPLRLGRRRRVSGTGSA